MNKPALKPHSRSPQRKHTARGGGTWPRANNPPGPGFWQGLATGQRFQHDALGLLREWQRDDGDLVYLGLGRLRFYWLFRLLNAYLAGTLDEPAYEAKVAEFKSETLRIEESASRPGENYPVGGELALALIDWTQNAAVIWRGSNNRVRREILDSVCLNRTLGDVNLVATKRKPFDVFAKGLEIQNSRPTCRYFEPVITDFVDASLRPAPHLRRLEQLARECA